MTYPYAPSVPQSFRCINHPDREGVGICVSCRSVVCVECSTKIDRMNYCIRCLQAASQPARAAEENPRASVVWGIPVLLLAFLGTAVVFAGLGFVLALLRVAAGGGVTAG